MKKSQQIEEHFKQSRLYDQHIMRLRKSKAEAMGVNESDISIEEIEKDIEEQNYKIIYGNEF